ncbi:hypothetical protein PspLS_10424 [Pyricularia sp. CBS 133598]|nr:hypothetical protein PspLS_10424 [Pyricularia sp. CBS 133598]
MSTDPTSNIGDGDTPQAPSLSQDPHPSNSVRGKSGGEQNDLTIRFHYIDHRPPYPESMWRIWTDYHAGRLDTALDIGSGTGNAAHSLIDHVKSKGGPALTHMILSDPYQDKIDDAKAIVGDGNKFLGTRFSYRVRRGEDAWEEADGEVDLVMSCASLHWTDYLPTMANVARVVRSGGTFAAVTYSPFPDIIGNDEADRLLVQLIKEHGDMLDRAGFLKKNPKWLRVAQQLAACMGAVPFSESEWTDVKLFRVNCPQTWRPDEMLDEEHRGAGDLPPDLASRDVVFINDEPGWRDENATITWLHGFLESLQYGFTAQSLAASATWAKFKEAVGGNGGRIILNWGVQMILARRK